MAFNANDVLSIQECLESYNILLNWVPPTTKEEADLKYMREELTKLLINKCEVVLKEMKDEQSNNRWR